MEIQYVGKDQLEKGQVGVCIKHADGSYTLRVGNWFWKCMQKWIEDHEIYHTIDPEDEFWTTDERQASSYAFKNHPIGGVVNLLHFIISPSRWKYYFRRAKTST